MPQPGVYDRTYDDIMREAKEALRFGGSLSEKLQLPVVDKPAPASKSLWDRVKDVANYSPLPEDIGDQFANAVDNPRDRGEGFGSVVKSGLAGAGKGFLDLLRSTGTPLAWRPSAHQNRHWVSSRRVRAARCSRVKVSRTSAVKAPPVANVRSGLPKRSWGCSACMARQPHHMPVATSTKVGSVSPTPPPMRSMASRWHRLFPLPVTLLICSTPRSLPVRPLTNLLLHLFRNSPRSLIMNSLRFLSQISHAFRLKSLQTFSPVDRSSSQITPTPNSLPVFATNWTAPGWNMDAHRGN
jgi:hypothetical protein